jgi:hypothetical protein
MTNDGRKPQTKRPVLCKTRPIYGTQAGKGKVGYIDSVLIPPISGHSRCRARNPGVLGSPEGSVANLADRSAWCTFAGNGFGGGHVMIEFKGSHFERDVIVGAITSTFYGLPPDCADQQSTAQGAWRCR